MIRLFSKLLIIIFFYATTSNFALANNKKLPTVKSEMAMVVHQNSDFIIYEKKAYTKTSIASLTKLMTAMVIIDSGLKLNEKVRISKLDIDRLKWTGSRVPIGTKLSRMDLLSISLMSSDNRAASALSRSYPGGKKAFIKAMNVKALKLGMHNSRFADPTGLDKRNISTARDLVRMARAAYQYPLIRKLTTNPEGKVRVGKHRRSLGFLNTNSLVRKGQWNIGLSKTGFIREAGRCLLMQTMINNEPVIIILLDSYGKYTRIADAKRIKTWMEKNASKLQALKEYQNLTTKPS